MPDVIRVIRPPAAPPNVIRVVRGSTVKVIRPAAPTPARVVVTREGSQGRPGTGAPPSGTPDGRMARTVGGVVDWSTNPDSNYASISRTGTRAVGQGELTFNVKDYGALGNGITDDSASIMTAATAAAGGCLLFPPGVYLADSLAMTSQMSTWRSASPAMTRFGPGAAAAAAVIIRHVAGSANVLLDMHAGGLTLDGIMLDGNSAPGTLLQVSNGFENRIKTVRCAYGTGIGLLIQGSDNATYDDVFVDNCGSDTAPQVQIQVASPLTINTLNMQGLNIERAGAATVDLDINSHVDDSVTDYPFVVRLDNLHIEHASDNGAVANTGPVITAGNFTTVILANPFLYGGPGPLLTYDQESTNSGLGGLVILGGQLRGRGSSSGHEPATLVHLVKGNQFVMLGTRVENYTAQAVLIDSTFGPDVLIDPTVIGLGTVVTDNRAAINPHDFRVPVRVNSRLGAVSNSGAAARGIYLGANSGGLVVGIATGAHNYQITTDDVNNRFTFNLAGIRQLGYFDLAGNFTATGGFTRALATKTADYTLVADGTVLISGGHAPTLPTAIGASGREYTVKNVDAALASTIATTSGQTVDGLSSIALIPGASVTVQSDGSNWRVISGFGLLGALAGLAAPFVPGDYYAPIANGVGTLTLANGALRGGLLIPGRTCTLTEVGIEVATAGSTGSVVRLGIYRVRAGSSDTADLLLDAGTIDATSTGYKSVTVSQPVNAGDKLLLIAAAQGSPATSPIVRSSTGAVPYLGNSTALTVSQNAVAGIQASGVTGALSATLGLSVSTGAARVLALAAS